MREFTEAVADSGTIEHPLSIYWTGAVGAYLHAFVILLKTTIEPFCNIYLFCGGKAVALKVDRFRRGLVVVPTLRRQQSKASEVVTDGANCAAGIAYLRMAQAERSRIHCQAALGDLQRQDTDCVVLGDCLDIAISRVTDAVGAATAKAVSSYEGRFRMQLA